MTDMVYAPEDFDEGRFVFRKATTVPERRNPTVTINTTVIQLTTFH
jgi:hypothetical protein